MSERWLLTTYFTLVHAAGRDVAAGTMTADEAQHAVISTLLAAYSAAPEGRQQVLEPDCHGGR